MKELMYDVETAFKAISNISVSGDAVDAVALARMKLRGVYAKLKEIDESNVSDSEKEM